MALFLLPFPWEVRSISIMGLSKIDFLSQFLYRSTESLVYRYSGKSIIESVVKGKQLKLEISSSTGPQKVYVEGIEKELNSRDSGYYHFKLRDLLDLKYLDPVDYAMLIPNSDSFRQNLGARLGEALNWSIVEKTGAHFKLVKDFVSKVIDDEFTEVTVKFNRLALRKVTPSGEPFYVELEHVGDGVKRFLTCALWLEAVKPRAVLWDDLEASAHPSLLNGIIKWLSEHDWQVVMSTHSIDVLREILSVELEDAKILSLRKLPDDTLTYREYSLDELEEFFEKGVDVRKLFTPREEL